MLITASITLKKVADTCFGRHYTVQCKIVLIGVKTFIFMIFIEKLEYFTVIRMCKFSYLMLD